MEFKTIAVIIMAVVVIIAIAALFLQYARPSEDVVTFQIGCMTHCQEIQDLAQQQGSDSILRIGVEKAMELQNSDFYAACKRLYGVYYPWECWSKACCKWG